MMVKESKGRFAVFLNKVFHKKEEKCKKNKKKLMDEY